MRITDLNNLYFLALSVIAVLIVGGSLWYSNRLVSQLAQKEEQLVSFWAAAIHEVAVPSEDPTNFLFDYLIKPKVIPVPAIVADAAGNPTAIHNLKIPPRLSFEAERDFLASELEQMRANSAFAPIAIEYYPGEYQYIYYRETDELRQLRRYPYITLGILLLFVALVFGNYYLAQRSQQDKVWVGLARETAHQLGTPISGLIGWIELLKTRMRSDDDLMILTELRRDIAHLEIIAERFSKIGSEPELKPTELEPLLAEAVSYIRSRASQKIEVRLESQLPAGFHAQLNPMLFVWVIENLLKNGLDALSGTGYLIVRAQVRGQQLMIEVEDSGKGITRSQAVRIFRPGFTTKKRGWGLGLSLSKRIIEQYHRGRLVLHRSEVRKGSTFRITLPVGKV
jgi:signal transduction histidine kinase